MAVSVVDMTGDISSVLNTLPVLTAEGSEPSLPAGFSRAEYVQREKSDRVSRALRTFHRTAPALVSQRSDSIAQHG